VLEGMKMVARSGGTAKGTFADYPVDVACKTGTAETGKRNTSDNAAFVCFAPAEEPKIAISIYGEQAGHGSGMAGIAKSLLDYYLNLEESSDVNSYENAVS
jgi:penicillin-binding protein 2